MQLPRGWGVIPAPGWRRGTLPSRSANRQRPARSASGHRPDSRRDAEAPRLVARRAGLPWRTRLGMTAAGRFLQRTLN